MIFFGLNEELDVVLVGIGVEVMFEVIKVVELFWEICLVLKVRVVNVIDFMIFVFVSRYFYVLSKERFLELFMWERLVLFNYYGYLIEL